MPVDHGTGFLVHELREPSAESHSGSFFVSRQPHFALELIGSVVDEKNLATSQEWVIAMSAELSQTDEVIEGTYVSLTGRDDNPLSKTYNSEWETLLQLKKKYDPERVFDLAVPRLNE